MLHLFDAITKSKNIFNVFQMRQGKYKKGAKPAQGQNEADYWSCSVGTQANGEGQAYGKLPLRIICSQY